MRAYGPTILVCLLAAAGAVQAAETGVLAGRVTDSRSGDGVSRASVVIEKLGLVGETDPAGRYRIEGLPPGSYTVTAIWPGFARASDTVEITADTSSSRDFSLMPRPITSEYILVEADAPDGDSQAVVSQTDLIEDAPHDVGKYMRTVPGMSAVRRGGTNLDPVFRGYRADQLRVVVDGGVMVCGACPNRMDPPSGHVQAEDLRSIELVKGPSAARFGPIFGGLVNLVLGPPVQYDSFEAHASLDTSYETNADGRRGRLSLWAGDRLYDVYLSGGAKDYGDYTGGDGQEVDAGFRVYDYSLKAGLKPTLNQRFQATVRQSFQRDALYSALPMDATVDDTGIYALDYAYRPRLGGLAAIIAKAYHSDVHHVMDNGRKPNYSMVRSETIADTAMDGGRLESQLLAAGGMLYAGLDGSRLNMDGDRTRAFVTGPYAGQTFEDVIWPDAVISDVGAFAQYQRPLAVHWDLDVGLRTDWVTAEASRPDPAFAALYGDDLDDRETNTGAHANLDYVPGTGQTISLGIGHGVRTASAWERYLFLLPVGVDRYDYVGDPHLAPEQITQVELGYRIRNWPIQLDVAAYYGWLTDYISAALEPDIAPRSPGVLGVKRFINIDEATKYGYEIAALVALNRSWSVEGALAQVIGETGDSEPLPEMPPLEGRLGLRLQPPEAGWWAEVAGRAAARQNRISSEFGEQETPSFALLNLAGGWSPAPYLQIIAAVDNVLDRQYFEHLNRMQTETGERIPETGRSFRLGLRVEM